MIKRPDFIKFFPKEKKKSAQIQVLAKKYRNSDSNFIFFYKIIFKIYIFICFYRATNKKEKKNLRDNFGGGAWGGCRREKGERNERRRKRRWWRGRRYEEEANYNLLIRNNDNIFRVVTINPILNVLFNACPN